MPAPARLQQPRGGGSRVEQSVRAPPKGFDAAKAMDRIFELGLQIAQATHEGDKELFYSQFRLLKAQLRVWSLWEDSMPRRQQSAAVKLQAGLRGLLERSRYRLALGQIRARQVQADAAATSIQKQKRASQAKELVARRRAAIRIQKHARGRAARVRFAAMRGRAGGGRGGGLFRSLSFGRFRKKGKASPGGSGGDGGAGLRSESPASSGGRRRSYSFGSQKATPTRRGGGGDGRDGGGASGSDGGSGSRGGWSGGGRGSYPRPPLTARPSEASFEDQLRRQRHEEQEQRRRDAPRRGGGSYGLQRAASFEHATRGGRAFGSPDQGYQPRGLPQPEKFGRSVEQPVGPSTDRPAPGRYASPGRRPSGDNFSAGQGSPAGRSVAGGVDLRRNMDLFD